MEYLLMRLSFYILLLTFFPFFLFSQNQNNNWVFGYHSTYISFDNCEVQIKDLPPASHDDRFNFGGWEGVSTISDYKTGKTILYSDGRGIFNGRNERINTTDRTYYDLKARTISQISFLKIPESDSLYYFFVTEHMANFIDVDDRNGMFIGFTYSLIDITGNNGRGEIIEKKVISNEKYSEKLTTILHSNGIDVWVIVHKYESDEFESYLVTANGLDETPISSKVGKDYLENYRDNIGKIKSNLQRDKIVVTSIESEGIELFKFNNTTGQIYDPILIDEIGEKETNVALDRSRLYGTSFSPDGTKLYVGTHIRLLQYDISIYNKGKIESSRYQLHYGENVTGNNFDIGAIRSAPDGKLYIASAYQKLSVIHKPNELNEKCEFDFLNFDLKGGDVYLGINSLMEYPPINKRDFSFADTVLICGAESYNIDLPDTLDNYFWSDGTTSPDISISESGKYWINAQKGYCSYNDTIQVIIIPEADFVFSVPDTVLQDAGNEITIPVNVEVSERENIFIDSMYIYITYNATALKMLNENFEYDDMLDINNNQVLYKLENVKLSDIEESIFDLEVLTLLGDEKFSEIKIDSINVFTQCSNTVVSNSGVLALDVCKLGTRRIEYLNPLETKISYDKMNETLIGNFNQYLDANVEIEVFNNMGSKLLSKNIQKGQLDFELKLNNFSSNIYFVRIKYLGKYYSAGINTVLNTEQIIR